MIGCGPPLYQLSYTGVFHTPERDSNPGRRAGNSPVAVTRNREGA